MKNAQLTRLFGLGTIQEIFHGDRFEPGGTDLQGWSESMVIQPAIEGLFGLKPDAAKKRLTIAPQLPPSWGHAAVRNVHVGESVVDIELWQNAGWAKLLVRHKEGPALKEIVFRPHLPYPAHVTNLLINGASEATEVEQCAITVELEGAAYVEPVVVAPGGAEWLGQLMILDVRHAENAVQIDLAGIVGKQYELKIRTCDPITQLTDATLARSDGEMKVLKVSFPTTGGPGYVRKTVWVRF